MQPPLGTGLGEVSVAQVSVGAPRGRVAASISEQDARPVLVLVQERGVNPPSAVLIRALAEQVELGQVHFGAH